MQLKTSSRLTTFKTKLAFTSTHWNKKLPKTVACSAVLDKLAINYGGFCTTWLFYANDPLNLPPSNPLKCFSFFFCRCWCVFSFSPYFVFCWVHYISLRGEFYAFWVLLKTLLTWSLCKQPVLTNPVEFTSDSIHRGFIYGLCINLQHYLLVLCMMQNSMIGNTLCA